jgi:rubrerythrin
MAALKGSRTEQCLKDAFAGESQANGHAHGHLEFLEQSGDPATGMPIGSTRQNLASAVAGETHEYTDMYPGMAKTARDEGFDEVADWFETLAKAERSHANRYQKALTELVD